MIKELPEIPEQLEVFGFSTAGEIINQTLHQTTQKHCSECKEGPHIPSGFNNLDNITKGFRRGTLTTIGTRPGNGKTAFVLSIIHNISVTLRHRVVLFTPERSARKVVHRLIESHTSHSVDKIRKGLLRSGDQEHVMSLVRAIGDAGLYIDDSVHLHASEIAARCRQAITNPGVEIVLMDSPESYVMHIADPERRQEAFREIVTTLKEVAQEYCVPVVVFTQLPKPSSFENGGFIPSLKEIEPVVAEASDDVIFIHRPEYYQLTSSTVPAGMVSLITGKLGNIEEKQETFLKFIESIDRFTDPD